MYLSNFTAGKNFYRGNLHTHTTVSDGCISPKQTAEWYRQHGYDFLAITDHWRTLAQDFQDEMLVIPGVEFDAIDPKLGLYHMVGVNIRQSPDRGGLVSIADAAAYIRQHGGLPHICHPYWCGMSFSLAETSEDIKVIEVFNATCEIMIAKGLSAVYWDDALAKGKRLWGLAVDDTHNLTDFGVGWVMVQAEKLTADAIVSAVSGGRFYSSTGPEIYDFHIEGRTAYARTSAAKRIAFVGDRFFGHCCGPENSDSINEAEYQLPDDIAYVRLEVDDAQGKRAWSNPLYLK